MPTAATTTYSGNRLEPLIKPELCPVAHVALKVSTTYVAGMVLGQVTTGGKFAPYATGAADGSEQARALMMYDGITDASGNFTPTTTAAQVGNDVGSTMLTVPVYMGGMFKTEDLTGLDAAAVADLSGLLVAGTVTSGILRF